MIDKTILPLIEKYASIYQIDIEWIQAIILTESSGDTYAMRYEGSYPYLFNAEACAKKANVSLATEIATQKISWGLGQVMGALAREQGHTRAMGELLIPDVNIKHMCIRLQTLKRRSEIADDVFAGYNGGPGAMRLIAEHKYANQHYVDKVNKNLKLV